jgi:hypothetical protein
LKDKKAIITLNQTDVNPASMVEAAFGSEYSKNSLETS